MQQFTSVHDIHDVQQLVEEALQLKHTPLANRTIGNDYTIALVFFNPSLRTRMSTQKAAINLGLSVITLNAVQGWRLEFEDEVVMNSDRAEHIREAAAVISQYADIIGIRTFAGLTDRESDYADTVLNKFIQFASVPVISLESAIRHPLQSLADLMTIREHQKVEHPKIVLSWAPHPKALPQAVANSFAEWVQHLDAEFVITHPKGYELAPEFTGNAAIEYDQKKALASADFVYTKNWSSFQDYGKVSQQHSDWTVTTEKMAGTNNGHFMHCLPVRRNVVVADQVIDGPKSLVIQQANNRTYAAQIVLKKLIENLQNATHETNTTYLETWGKLLQNQAATSKALAHFCTLKGPKLLVHGGGTQAATLAQQLQIPTQMHAGRRITDAATLDIVVMVYAGLLNKQLVSELQAKDCDAIGLCGADGNAIRASKRPAYPIDYGFAGDVHQVNAKLVQRLLNAEMTPVFSAITHNGQGQLLNTNADTIATQLAIALQPYFSVSLNFCFEKPGVLAKPSDEASVIQSLSTASFETYKANGTIKAGMLPKLDNAFEALQAEVEEIRIGNPHSITTGQATQIAF